MPVLSKKSFFKNNDAHPLWTVVSSWIVVQDQQYDENVTKSTSNFIYWNKSLTKVPVSSKIDHSNFKKSILLIVRTLFALLCCKNNQHEISFANIGLNLYHSVHSFSKKSLLSILMKYGPIMSSRFKLNSGTQI